MQTETLTLFHFDTLDAQKLHTFKACPNLLVQVFSSLHSQLDTLQELLNTLQAELPQAHIIGATTDGEIETKNVYTNSTVITFSCFEKTTLKTESVSHHSEHANASRLIEKTLTSNTKLMITFSDGTTTNGEHFLATLTQKMPTIPIAGGMAGDNATFTQTYIIHGNKILKQGAVAVTLNSDVLHVTTDYSFDWQPLGRAMHVTKAKENRVYEVDHMPITQLYGKYLGKEIEDALPNIGIEFPLLLTRNTLTYARAAVAKFDDGSLAFAGDINEGDIVHLGFGDIREIMQNSFKKAALFREKNIETFFIYSCMARRRFMQEIIHTEIEPFAEIAPTAGFFTYGEFFHQKEENYLFNETLTFVALSENIDAPVSNISDLKPYEEEEENNRTFRALSHLFKVTQGEYEFNQQLLNTVVETGRVGYFIRSHSNNDRVVFSDIAKDIVGLDLLDDKAYNTGWRAFSTLLRFMIHPDDLQESLEILREANRKCEGYELNCRIIRPDGEIRYVKMITHLGFESDGTLGRTVGTIYDLTTLKEEQIRHEELSFLIENAISEIYIVDVKNLQYRYVNTKTIEVLGYSKEEMMGMSIYDINPDLTPEHTDKLIEIIATQHVITNESVHQCKDGSRYPTRSQIYPTYYFGEEVYVIFSTDISEEKAQIDAQENLKKSLENVLDYSGTYFILTDSKGILYANKALLTFLNLKSVEELTQKYHCILDFFEEDDNYFSAKQLKVDCKDCGCISTIMKNDILGIMKHVESGQKRVMKLNLNKLPNGNFIISMTDVTQIEQDAKRFEYQANHDKLTGVYNRSYFDFIYQKHLDNFVTEHRNCSFILLDIDNFKQINDIYGHLTGDRVLILMSSTISQKIRRDDIFVRWGGEEFLLLLPNTIQDNAMLTAEIIRQEVSSIDIGIDRNITCSFGVTSCRNGDTKESLFSRLDKALYMAKESGKNCVKTL